MVAEFVALARWNTWLRATCMVVVSGDRPNSRDKGSNDDQNAAGIGNYSSMVLVRVIVAWTGVVIITWL